MSAEHITSLAYTAREINRIHTSLENFSIVLLSDMELGERVASCLGCFDSVEQAYAYNKKATESLGKEHLYTAIIQANPLEPARVRCTLGACDEQYRWKILLLPC